MRMLVDCEMKKMRKAWAKRPPKYNNFRDPRRNLSSSDSRFAS
jgi:hypothetical protein